MSVKTLLHDIWHGFRLCFEQAKRFADVLAPVALARLKTLLHDVWYGFRFCFERAKPFADVLAPVALVYFAYKTAEVSRQQVDIQQAQTEIQRAQINPVLQITYDDEDAEGAHKDAHIHIVNSGGTMLEVSIGQSMILNLSVTSRKDYHSYDWKYYLESGTGGGGAFGGPIHVSNLGEVNSNVIDIPVERDLAEVDRLLSHANKDTLPFQIFGSADFVIMLNYLDKSDSKRSDTFVVTSYSISRLRRKPVLETIYEDEKSIQAAATQLYDAKSSWFRDVTLKRSTDLPP
jgi:hypothetical protein